MTLAACSLELGNLVVELLPSSAEYMSSRDYDVNLIRSSFHRAPNFGDAFLHRRQAGGKSRGNGGYSNSAACERPHCGPDKPVINANRCHFDIEFFDLQLFQKLLLNRSSRLGAKAAYAVFRVVARECGEVHAGDCAQMPGGLPLLLHRFSRHMRLRPTFHGAGVDANLFHPIKIQWNTAIGKQRPASKGGDGRSGIWRWVFETAVQTVGNAVTAFGFL